MESGRVCTGVVIHVPLGGIARAISRVVQFDNVGLSCYEEAGSSDERGEKVLHGDWGRLRTTEDD